MKQLHEYRDSLMEFVKGLHVPLGSGTGQLGPAMADFQRTDFEALAESLEVLAQGKSPEVRRFWIERTKGGSKDTDMAVCVLWTLCFAPRPIRVQVAADDQQQADEVRLIVKGILTIDAPLNRMLRRIVDIQNTRIVVTRGIIKSQCEVLTRDKLGSHGARPDVVLINELSHIGDREFAETIFDNADKMPGGVLVIATNAGHIDTWQENWRAIAKNSARWYFSTLSEPAPWISEEDLADSALRNPAHRFRRLWCGAWTSASGDALEESDILAAILGLRNPNRPELGEHGPLVGTEKDIHDSFVHGLDLGVRNDHSALVTLAADRKRNRVRLAKCQSWKPGAEGQVDLMAVEEAVYEEWTTFGGRVFYDPHQAALMAQRLQRRGVKLVEYPFVGVNLTKMATTLVDTFRSRQIDLYRDEHLIADLRRLDIEEKSYGMRLSAPRDASGHCDLGTAFAIALPQAVAMCRSKPDEPWIMPDTRFTQPLRWPHRQVQVLRVRW